MSTPLCEREGLPSTKDAQSKAQSLADSEALSNAGALACWMILEKGFPLLQAKRSASKKFGVTQAAVDHLIRRVIPAWFFEDRTQPKSRSTKPAGTTKPRTNQKRLNQELGKQQDRHIKDL